MDEKVSELEALREKVGFLQLLLDTIPNPVFYKDAAGVYIGCNKAFEAYLGYPRERIVGHTVYDIAPRELAQVYEKADRAVLEKGGDQVYETKVHSADGGDRDVVFYKSVFVREGRPAGLIGVIVDITDRKRAEEDREKLIGELRQALSEVKTLSGILPICASCKKIRDDKGYWNQVESYITRHSEAVFTHGICTDCARRLYPGLGLDESSESAPSVP